MEHFSDLTVDDQVRELAEYLGQLNPEDAELPKRCADKLAAKDLGAVLGEIAARAPAVCDNATSGEAIEQVFNCIILLGSTLDSAKYASSVINLAKALTAADLKEFDINRLKVLVNLFNSLPKESAARFDIYMYTLELAGRLGDVRAVYSNLDQVDGWLRDWKSSPTQARKLYKAIYSHLKSNNQGSTQALIRYLRTFNGAADVAESKADALQVVSQVLADTETFDVSNLLALDAVKQLKGDPAHELLDIMEAEDLERYEAWNAKNGKTVADLGVSEGDLSRKVRLLRLATLCASQQEVDFATVAKHLRIEEADTEIWVIDAIRAGLIEARVDQVNQKVVVTHSKHAKFADVQWEDVKERLEKWQTHISEVQKVLGAVKQQVQEKSQAPPQQGQRGGSGWSGKGRKSGR